MYRLDVRRKDADGKHRDAASRSLSVSAQPLLGHKRSYVPTLRFSGLLHSDF